MTPTDLIGSAEACDLLDIDRSTLTRWVARGVIEPAQQLPGATGARLFHRRDIVALAGSAPDDTGNPNPPVREVPAPSPNQ